MASWVVPKRFLVLRRYYNQRRIICWALHHRVTQYTLPKTINLFFFKAESAEVVFGSTDIEAGESVTASQFILHEGYDEDIFANDIGLIKLETPLTLGGKIHKSWSTSHYFVQFLCRECRYCQLGF